MQFSKAIKNGMTDDGKQVGVCCKLQKAERKRKSSKLQKYRNSTPEGLRAILALVCDCHKAQGQFLHFTLLHFVFYIFLKGFIKTGIEYIATHLPS